MTEIFEHIGEDLVRNDKLFPKSSESLDETVRNRRVKKYPSRGGSAYVKWIPEGDTSPLTHPYIQEKYFAGIQNIRTGLTVFQYDKVRLRDEQEETIVAAVGTNVARAMRVWLCNGTQLFDTSFGDVEAVTGVASILEREQVARIFLEEHLGEGKDRSKKRPREELELGPIGNMRDAEEIHRQTAQAVLSLGIDVMDLPCQKKSKEEQNEDPVTNSQCNQSYNSEFLPSLGFGHQLAKDREEQLLKRVAVLELELEKIKEEQEQIKTALEQVQIRGSLQQFLQQNKFAPVLGPHHR